MSDGKDDIEKQLDKMLNKRDGKDEVEKQLDKMLNKRLKVVNSQRIKAFHSSLGIVTIHQVAEMIFNLAMPIANFTSSPEKYCQLWHEEIGKDIEGIKSMLLILERTYGKVDAALQGDKLGQ